MSDLVTFPAAFPAVGGGFPASPAASDPLFGVNPYTPGTNMYLPLGAAPTPGLPNIAERAAQQQHLMQLATMSSLGLAPDTDPTEWTPEQAALQTDQSIAKVASVNPEAAQRLAERRAPGQDTGGGFWDSLKEVAGDLLSPALSFGGKVLDIIGRTANIVPNIAFDVADGGGFDLGHDIGGAFTGEMRHNWNSVFQEMGWDGGGIGGFLRATVGLVGDIATDPLTWLIPAGAGVKAGEAASTAGRTVATRTESILTRGAKLFGEEGDALVTKLTGAYDQVIAGARSKGWKMGDDLDERVWGLIAQDFHGAEKDLLGDMFKLSDQAYRGIRARGFATWARKGKVMLSDGSVVEGQAMRQTMEQVVKNGGFSGKVIGSASPEWKAARQMASALGGVRFKANLPFTNLRYISPAIPGSKFVSEKTIGAVSRMFAGQSGMNRMLAAISKGDASMDDLKVWMEQGYDAAYTKNPDLVQGLRGRFKNMGSMAYSASEQIGRITAHLDSGARATRAGLAGYHAQAQAKEVRSAYQQFIRSVAYDVKLPDGRVLERDQVLKLFESQLGVSLRKKGQKATVEQMSDYARYLDWFPPSVKTSDPQAIANWFYSTPQYANAAAAKASGSFGELSKEAQEAATLAFAKAEKKLNDMQDLAKRLTPEQRRALDTMNTIWDNVRNQAAKRDAVLTDVRMNFENVGILHPAQADEWAMGTHPYLQQDLYLDVDDAGKLGRAKQAGISEDLVGDTGDLHGIRVSNRKGSGSLRARIRGGDWVIVDNTPGRVSTDEDLLLLARQESEAIADRTGEAVSAASQGVEGMPRVSEKHAAKTASELSTEYIRKQRPDASGVIYRNADGSMEVVVFDHANIKVIDEGAAHVVQERGFFHRTFTREASEWLRGKLPREGRTLLVAEPEVEAFIRRKTIGMDIDEAETFIRDYLSKEYGIEGLPERVWDTNPLTVHEDYIENAANAIAAESTGQAAQRMVTLGDMAPAMFGTSPRGQKYDWMLHPNLIRSLQRKDRKLTRAVMQSVEKDAARMQEQQRQLAETAERYGMFGAMVEEALGAGVEVPDRIVEAARRYGRTFGEARQAARAEREALDASLAQHADDLARYENAQAQLLDDPAYGHPGAGQPAKVIDNPDGTQTVLGWHFRDRPGSPGEALEGVRGIDMSNNGFHLGDFDTAVSRANIVADAEGKTIGWRGKPDTWPTETYEVGGAIEPLEGETNEAFMRRLDATEAVTAERQVEPDWFYDDLVYPVEVRGRFKGSAPGESVPTEGELGASFSGSPVGETQQKAIDRAALQKDGFDGAFYENAVEGNATYPSIVLLEPSGLVESNAARRFEEAVADRKVWVDAEGKVSGKRTAGSRMVRPKAGTVAEVEKLSRQRAAVDDLLRSLEKGDNTVMRFPDDGDLLQLSLEDVDRLADRELWDAATSQGAGKVGKLRREEFLGLKDDIGRRGIQEPLEVFVDPETGQAIMGEGFHRWRALHALAKEGAAVGDIPVKVVYTPGTKGKALYAGARGVPTRRVAESAASLGKATAAAAKKLGQEERVAARKLATLKTRTHNAMTEANKAYAEFHGAVAQAKPVLVKAETAGNLAGMTRLKVPGLEGYAMPSYIAEEFHHQFDLAGPGGLRQAWRQYVMGPWKRWATYRWPGFHVRNFFGAFFNNWLGGVGMAEYNFSWRVNHALDGNLKWASRKVSAEEMDRYALRGVFGGHTPTYTEVGDLLAEQGIGRANVSTVMGIEGGTSSAKEVYRQMGGDATKVRRAARRFDDSMRNMGRSVEDFHRVAAWGAGMSAAQGDVYGARAFVMMRHGDYSDLTDAEDFIRDVVPFYKWMRTNVPYQIRMLAENPGQMTALTEKAKRYAYDVQGLDYEEAQLQLPDYARQTLSIPIPDWVPVIGSESKDALHFAMLDLPYADLYNGLADYMSSTLPIARNVLESYGFKQQLFSGKPLTGEYKPLSGAFNLPGVRDILHTFGLTQRGADGREYMEDKLQNVLTAWPIFSRFRNFTESDPDRVDARLGGLFSTLVGVGIKEGDYTETELDFYYNEVRPLLDQYRSLGVQLPSVEDFQSGEVGAQVGLTTAEDVPSPLTAVA